MLLTALLPELRFYADTCRATPILPLIRYAAKSAMLMILLIRHTRDAAAFDA